MTADKADLITFGGVAVHQRLANALPEVVDAVLARLVEQLPVYGALPAEQLSGDISRIAEQSLRTFVEVLRTNRQPDEAHFVALQESAATRAEEGVPLDAVLSAYHVGVQVCLDHLEAAAEPADVTAVCAAQRLVLRYLQLVTAAVSAGYFQERQTMFGEEHAARQALLAALLDGMPAHDAAERAGIRLPVCYLVLSLTVSAHPDEQDSGVDNAVAGRRKLRRLRVELERHAREPVLSMLSVDGGLALIPYDVAEPDLATDDWSWLGTLLDRMIKVSGVDIVAGVVATDPDGVPDAARLAGEVREVAVTFAHPPGVHRLSDVLLEYQLTRPSAARDELAALVRPLTDKPELLGTVRTFLSNGLNRRQTASLLRVHPNTVDYRLRKVAALTGLDTTQAADLPKIRAALAAHDATAG